MKKYTILTIILIIFILLFIASMGVYFLKKDEIKAKMFSYNTIENTIISEQETTEPEPEVKVIKTIGTGIKRPANYAPEVGYEAIYRGVSSEEGLNALVSEIKDEELKNKIKEFISTSKTKLENEKEEFEKYIEEGNKKKGQVSYQSNNEEKTIDYYQAGEKEIYYKSEAEIKTEWKCLNGYLSIGIYIPYNYGNNIYEEYGEQRNYGAYDAYCATYDLYTGKKLKFSDLFFEGEDYSTEVYEFMQSEIGTQRLGEYIKREFTTIDPDYDDFSINSIYFAKTNKYFSEGAIIPLRENLNGYNYVTMFPALTIQRDMEGIFSNKPEIVNSTYTYRRYVVQKDISGVPFKISKIKHWDDKIGAKINNNIEKYLKYLIDNNEFVQQIVEREQNGDIKRKEEKNSILVFDRENDIIFNVYFGLIYPDLNILVDYKTGDLIEITISDLAGGGTTEQKEELKKVTEELKKI